MWSGAVKPNGNLKMFGRTKLALDAIQQASPLDDHIIKRCGACIHTSDFHSATTTMVRPSTSFNILSKGPDTNFVI